MKELGLQDSKVSRIPGAKPVKARSDPEDDDDDTHEEIKTIEEGSEEMYDEIMALKESMSEPSHVQPEEAEEDMDVSDATVYRAVTARPNYLAVDRADIQYAVKEVVRK